MIPHAVFRWPGSFDGRGLRGLRGVRNNTARYVLRKLKFTGYLVDRGILQSAFRRPKNVWVGRRKYTARKIRPEYLNYGAPYAP